MNGKRTHLLAVVVCVGLLAAGAAGQVGQVNTGRATDSNYQVGSGGYNRPGRINGRINSQLYITGQVTGLAGFRGDPGYFASNQLRLDLPSETFRTFRGQSIGLAQVTQGSTYRASPYFSPMQTALKARAIAAGFNAPGTTMPKVSTPPPGRVRQLYRAATTDYRVLLPKDTAGLTLSDTPVSPLSSPTGQETAFRWIRPGPTALFGLARVQDQKQLVEDIAAMGQRDDSVRAKVDGQVDGHVDGQADKAPKNGALETDPTLPPLPAGNVTEPTDQPPSDLPAPDQDVYVDLLVALSRGRLQTTDPARLLVDRPRGKGTLVERRGKAIILHSLAGTGPDQFNRFMRRARQNLKKGKFYAAADHYELALTIGPARPLARLGLSFARFGAGEERSAGDNLARALRMFPALMETRVDVTKLMGTQEFADRMAALDTRLQGSGKSSPVLLLLAAFNSHNAGETGKARGYAKQLRAVAGKDKLLSAYANFLLTGQRPGQKDR